ncbi:hypothetical protein J1614_008491 [Plenodomus biglobosus]|nr:hypothetical protein J1614_008491 [Plenodomus biglobosus]
MNSFPEKRRKVTFDNVTQKADPVTNALGPAMTGTAAASKTKITATKPVTNESMDRIIAPTELRIHTAQAQLNARVDELIVIHKQIAVDVKSRRILMNLRKHNGRYCVACSPKGNGSTCGRTCPLLRPEHGNVPTFWFDQQWWHKADIIAKQHEKVSQIMRNYTPDQIGCTLLSEYEAIAVDAYRFGLPYSYRVKDRDTRQKMSFANPFDSNRPC